MLSDVRLEPHENEKSWTSLLVAMMESLKLLEVVYAYNRMDDLCS